MFKDLLIRILAIIFSGLIIGPSFAEVEDNWQEGDFSKARLVANFLTSPAAGEGVLYLGWHVEMEPGWKTYWRTPGSAGLPPQFDWQGSENIAVADILYPSPERFEIFDLHTYGYHDAVVYPIRITPENQAEAIKIRASVNYLVCKDLCVPVSASFELDIPANNGAAIVAPEASLINRFLAMVPSSISETGNALQITDYSILGGPGAENIRIRLKADNLLSGADIIMEDKQGFKFGIPKKRLLTNPSEAEFIIPVRAEGDNDSISDNQVVVIVMDGWNNFEEHILEFE